MPISPDNQFERSINERFVRTAAAWLDLQPQLGQNVFDAMTRIRTLIADRPGEEVDFKHCLPIGTADDPRRALMARSAAVSSLIAVLELARNGEVVVAQAKPLGAILVRHCV